VVSGLLGMVLLLRPMQLGQHVIPHPAARSSRIKSLVPFHLRNDSQGRSEARGTNNRIMYTLKMMARDSAFALYLSRYRRGKARHSFTSQVHA